MTNKLKKRRKRQVKEQQRQQLLAEKGQKKRVRHNTAANQEKHRADWQPLEPNEQGVIADRRIMPRDEQTRRIQTAVASQQAISANIDEALWQELAAESPFQLGMVVEVSRGLCRVAVDGRILICDLRGALIAEGSGYTNVTAVGDRVLVQLLAEDRGLVEEVLPRRSGLARPDSFDVHLKQIIAANVEQALIVASWREPHLWLQLIDEYLIGAARNNLTAVICINKIDLAEDTAMCRELVRPYADLNYSLHLTSAATGQGLDDLRAALEGKTTVLAGMSGVGKSSLLTVMDGNLNLKTNAVSLKRHEGKHTTTQAVMLPFGQNAYVVDTPGIREMGLDGLRQSELLDFYPDVAEFMAGCRFNDCTHSHEPGCAVKTAVADGTLVEWRLENYRKIYQSIPE